MSSNIELKRICQYCNTEFTAKTVIDKRHNTETIQIGESIRQRKENFLNKPEIYSEYEKEQLRIRALGEKCFVEYFQELANKRKGSNYSVWASVLKYLKNYTDKSIRFNELNENFLEGFKEYLLTTKRNKNLGLSQNTASSYFNKIKASLKQAYKEGILQVDLNSKVDTIKEQETRKAFLTIDELNKLVKSRCPECGSDQFSEVPDGGGCFYD